MHWNCAAQHRPSLGRGVQYGALFELIGKNIRTISVRAPVFCTEARRRPEYNDHWKLKRDNDLAFLTYWSRPCE